MDKINNYLRRNPFFYLEISDFSRWELNLVGGKSLTYAHELRIIFKEVSFVSLPMDWEVDVSALGIALAEGKEECEINLKYQIEIGNYIFKLFPKGYDDKIEFIIIAKEVFASF
ncbi:hypothetical protein CDO73_02605 [Saccharibacillus sp. O23]|nr:hypothetical protein CDO73_02605 [Saccharibacillus sp. O23]